MKQVFFNQNSFITSNRNKATYRVLYTEPNAQRIFSHHLFKELKKLPSANPFIIVCIGTDRSTGDSLGPLVGTFLKKCTPENTVIFGTLEEPVHAINLQTTITKIELLYEEANIIAIDACLGQKENVGWIQVGTGPIKPGAGVNKNLPSVGHIHITGTVNVSGFMEYVVLQNTRLNLVMKMAEIISCSLYKTINKLLKPNNIII